MSASHRFIFSTFLFLALSCFAVTSVFADTTYNYFQDSNSQCYATINQACSARLASDSANYQKLSPPRSVSLTNCQVSPPQYSIRVTYKDPNYPQPFESDSGAFYIVNTLSKTCPSGTILKIEGCTATCEVDPCKSKQGQKESVSVQCGTASCSSGVTIAVGSSAFTCSAGVATFSPQSPTGNAVKDACAMVGITSEDLPTLADARAKTEDLGSSRVPMYCNYTYEYTGQSGGQDTPLNNASLTLSPFSGAIPPDEQGNCDNPEYPIKGIKDGQTVCYPQDDGNNCPVQGEKQNSNGVCVGPDDPTYPKDTDPTKPDPKVGCDAGKIKNASGVCVPYADATKCGVGMIRSNTGVCIVDPKASQCLQGQVKNASGACVTDPKGTGCKNDALPDKLGVCPTGESACSTGKIRDASGACVGKNPNAPPDGTGCKDGSTPNAQGVCADGSGACSPGKVRSSSGACVLDTSDGNTSGSSSSNCEVAPECGGDPLQCASLEQIWRSGCDQIKAMSEISQEDADKMASAASAAKTEAESHQAAVDSQAEGFFSDFETKANAVSSSAECISDASFSVMGKSLIVPFSQACPFFKFLRLLVLFSAYMLSARILFGGVS